MKYALFGLIAFALLLTFAYGSDCQLDGHEFNKGEEYQPPGQCLKTTCEGGNKMWSIGCPSSGTLKPCKFIPVDLSKPYPQCCPRFECDD